MYQAFPDPPDRLLGWWRFAVLGALASFVACSPTPTPEAVGDGASARPVVVVSIAPYQPFAERLTAGFADVAVLVGAGQSPETYEVTPRQMESLTRAKVLVATGMPFERNLVPKLRAAAPSMSILQLADAAEGGHRHDAEADPHRWLDPMLMIHDVNAMAKTLATAFPERAAQIDAAENEIEQELLALDGRIANTLAPYKGRAFYVYHPAFGHFAARYGLRQVAFEDAGKAPGAKYADELVHAMAERGVTTLFVQPQTAPANAERLALLAGATVVSLDPLATDYAANLEGIANAIVASYRAVDPVPLAAPGDAAP